MFFLVLRISILYVSAAKSGKLAKIMQKTKKMGATFAQRLVIRNFAQNQKIARHEIRELGDC